LTVLNTNDNGPGSLRQVLANISTADVDTILFAPNVTNTITLTSGELALNVSVNIVGPGSSLLAVSGNNSSTVFDILGGSVNISGLTIRNGRAAGAGGNTEQDGHDGRGGGIYNQGALVLTGCVIASNSVVGGQGGPTDSNFAGNGATGWGGGIFSIGPLSLTDCVIGYNMAVGGAGGQAGSGFAGGAGNGQGGGISSVGSTLLTRCSFVADTAAGGAGGTATSGGYPGNGGQGYGGALYTDGVTTVTNCTFSGSSALAGMGGGGSGSGVGGGVWSDYNLIQSTSGLTISGTTTHNILGQNPLLGPLQDNGGPTFTMALLQGSPAIDKGKSFGAATDQRGGPRIFDFPAIANAVGGDGSDIGAFELTPPVLAIQRAGNNVLLSWPATDTGYTLESKASLSSSILWSPVPGSPPIVAGRFTVTNNSASGNSFYRLRSP
jgi:hypothetical protein